MHAHAHIHTTHTPHTFVYTYIHTYIRTYIHAYIYILYRIYD